MAKTKTQKKAVTETVSAPVVVPAPEMIIEKSSGPKLNESELRQIEGAEAKISVARLEMAVAEQGLANYELQKQNLELAIERQKTLIHARANAFEQAKANYSTLSGEIFRSHGISGDRFSYDPSTGQIIIEEGLN